MIRQTGAKLLQPDSCTLVAIFSVNAGKRRLVKTRSPEHSVRESRRRCPKCLTASFGRTDQGEPACRRSVCHQANQPRGPTPTSWLGNAQLLAWVLMSGIKTLRVGWSRGESFLSTAGSLRFRGHAILTARTWPLNTMKITRDSLRQPMGRPRESSVPILLRFF